MVALLSRDNLALRQKLESVYTKMNNVQMVWNQFSVFNNHHKSIKYFDSSCMFWKQKIKDEKIDIKLCGGETGGDGLRTSKPM